MLDRYRYKGRHRAPTTTRRTAARIAAAGVVMAAPAVLATPAQGAADSTWDRLAQCESGQRWDYNGSSGFDGGLQFSPRTWSGFGGGEFARYAYQATREEQIAVAERVLAAQGWGAWPACSRRLGIRAEAATPRPSHRTIAADAPTPRTAAPVEASAGVYVVVAGDTLSGIAATHGTTWPVVFEANRDVVDDPDLIYVGEVVRV